MNIPVTEVHFVDHPSPWRRVRSHWVWPGIVWALRFWVAGGVVLFVAFIAAPFSEAASAVFAPGRHSAESQPPPPEWWPTELAASTVNYARPAVTRR